MGCLDVSQVCAELEQLALLFEAVETAGGLTAVREVFEMEGDTLVYRTTFEGARWKLTMPAEKEEILLRAEKLKAAARAVGDGTTKKFRECRRATRAPKPTLRQARRGKAVADRFLADGEKQNWVEYEKLYV